MSSKNWRRKGAQVASTHVAWSKPKVLTRDTDRVIVQFESADGTQTVFVRVPRQPLPKPATEKTVGEALPGRA